MRLTQARNAPSPRNSAICSKAARKASCATSSAADGSAPIPRSSPRTDEPCRRTSSPNAARSPRTKPTSSRSWTLSNLRFGVGDIAIAALSQALRGLVRPPAAAAGQPEDQVGHADEPRNRPRARDDAADNGSRPRGWRTRCHSPGRSPARPAPAPPPSAPQPAADRDRDHCRRRAVWSSPRFRCG